MMVAALVSIAGCATTPIPTENLVDVPHERVLIANYMQQNDAFGRVIVKRDAGVVGSACDIRIYVNKDFVALASSGERAIMYLPPGDHILSARTNSFVCGGGLVEARTTVIQGGTSTWRMSFTDGGKEFMLQPTAF